MPNCNVIGCGIKRSRKRPNITLHKLSSKQDKKKIWLETIGVENLKMSTKTIHICSLHFEESCFNRTLNKVILRDDAIPSRTLLPTLPFRQVDGSRKTAVGPSQPAKYPKNKKATREVQQVHQPGSKHSGLSDAIDDAGSSDDDNIPEPPPPPQLNLHTAQICRVCLALDVKMFDLRDTELKTMFQTTTGITFQENKGSKLGSLICWECAARLQAASRFIRKALFSELLLKGLKKKGQQIKKQYFETVKEEADSFISHRTLTVTETVHIVDIEDQNNMTHLVQSRDDDESENDETEEIMTDKIENSEMEVEFVAIETEIDGDRTCPSAAEQNKTKIIKVNPLDSTSSIEETINSSYSHPWRRTLLLSGSTSYQEDVEDQINKTFKIENNKKSKIVPKQNKKLKNPIKRLKVAVSHDHKYYLKGDSEDGTKKKNIKKTRGTSKKVSSQKVARKTQVF